MDETKYPKINKTTSHQAMASRLSRDQIAKDNEIEAGTVSSIIKDAKQEIPDIDLLREVALVLKKYGLDLSVLDILLD
jgi:hypothetical protein